MFPVAVTSVGDTFVRRTRCARLVITLIAWQTDRWIELAKQTHVRARRRPTPTRRPPAERQVL